MNVDVKTEETSPADDGLARIPDAMEPPSMQITPGLQLAAELAGLLTWEFLPQARTLLWSPDAERILGRTPPTTLAELLRCLHPDDRARVRSELHDLLHGSHRIDFTCRILGADGVQTRWIHIRGARFHDAELNHDRFLGVAQDISDYKQRELNASFLAGIQEDFTRSDDGEKMLRAFGEKTIAHLGLSRLTLSAVSEEGDTLQILHDQRSPEVTCATISGVQRLSTQLPPALRQKLSAGHAVPIDDITTDPRTADAAEALEACGARAHFYIPHLINGHWNMLLCACHKEAHVWDACETELLQELTERLSLRFERARIDLQLKQSEEHYRTLFESIDEGFCVIEMLFDEEGRPNDYRFLEVNPAFERQTGLPNAVGRYVSDLVPGLESHWFETYGKVARTGEPVRFINGAAGLDGRWFDTNAFRIGDPEQHLVAILFTDITARRHVEEAILQSEERVRRAMEIDTVGIIFFKPEGTITDANEAFLHMSGYTREDVKSGLLRWDAMTPEEWMPDSRHAIDEFLSEGRMTPYEKQYIRKDGSRWWGLFAASQIGENEGVKFIIDITASKQAEEERARLADIVETSQDAIIRCDPHGIVVDWNRAATDLYGYTPEEIIGQHVRLVVPPERRHESREMFTRMVRGEPVPPWESVRNRKDGSLVDVEIRMSPIRSAHGEIVGASAIIRDITERKRLAQAQEDFLVMASHDLRSPITVLLGRAQLMRRRKRYDEGSIQTIIAQARRIERLTTDLQQVVHLESGQFELKPVEVDLVTLAREAVERIRSGDGPFDFRFEAPDNPVLGCWDPHRMSQVLDNLLGNAVKYSPDGGRIRVRVNADAETARLHVTDQGVGIPADLQTQLFSRFYRADEAGVASGLGLGLYISRMLVNAHGGTISVDSAPGAGSTFSVTLPRQFVEG